MSTKENDQENEQVTNKNLFSNDNILAVTDEEFTTVRNGTADGEQTPFLPNGELGNTERIQHTFSG